MYLCNILFPPGTQIFSVSCSCHVDQFSFQTLLEQLSLILSCKSIFTTWTILSIFGYSLKLFLFFFVDQLILYIYKTFWIKFLAMVEEKTMTFGFCTFSCEIAFRGWNLLFKVAQKQFQHVPRRRFWWVNNTTLYQLMQQSWYQELPIIGEHVGIIFVTQ